MALTKVAPALVDVHRNGQPASLQVLLDLLYLGMANICDPVYAGGAKDGITNNSTAAILAAKADAEATGKVLYIPPGKFMLDQKLTLMPNTTYRGAGANASTLYCVGSGCLESLRGSGAIDSVDMRDFTIEAAANVAATTGLGVGTVRQSTFQDMRVLGFLVGVSVDVIGINVGNYWNRFINVTSACVSRETVGSISFKLGNNYPSGSTYPDTDYNVFIGCKSYTCETAIMAINAIGCRVHDHHSVVVGTGLNLIKGNDNYFQMTCENTLRLGGALAGTISNTIDIYNDGALSTLFTDQGWNHVVPRNLSTSVSPVPLKTLDCFVQDRVFTSTVGLARPMFKLQLAAHEAVATVTLAYSGYTAGVNEHAGVASWDIFRTGGSTPVAVLSRMVGGSRGSASFSGTTMTVVTGIFANGQTLAGAGIPVGTTIVAFTSGGGAAGSVATISANVGTLTTTPIGAVDTLYTVTCEANGDVTWILAGHASAMTILNTVVNVQGGGTPQSYPYKAFNQYVRLATA